MLERHRKQALRIVSLAEAARFLEGSISYKGPTLNLGYFKIELLGQTRCMES